MRIGIIGGYGDIGLETASCLKDMKDVTLRLGGRNPDKLDDRVREAFRDHEIRRVDGTDDSSLTPFLKDCQLIINASGMKKAAEKRLARRVAEAGIHYITASGTASLEEIETAGSCLIYKAGSLPGLSGVLPRWLGKGLETVESLRFYYGALDLFTPAAARDYLEGLFDEGKESMLVYRDGRLLPYRGASRLRLPFARNELELFPYYDEEARWLAKELAVREAGWFMALDEGHTLRVLRRARADYALNPEDTIRRLCAAAGLDCRQNGSYAGMVAEVRGTDRQGPGVRTLTLACPLAKRLTGFSAAACARLIAEGGLREWKGAFYRVPGEEKIAGYALEAPDLQVQRYEQTVEELLAVREGEI